MLELPHNKASHFCDALFFIYNFNIMIKKNIANKIWEAYFGSKKETQDAFNIKIKKTLYGENLSNGWTIDHIWPLNPKSLKGKKRSKCFRKSSTTIFKSK